MGWGMGLGWGMGMGMELPPAGRDIPGGGSGS